MEKRNQRQPAGKRGASGLVAGYSLLPGVPDEMIDASGQVRPGWLPLISALDEMGPSEAAARFDRADQYLRDAGVFYRKYDSADGKDRAWPLAHLPLIIEEAEWQRISRGLMQRTLPALLCL